MSWDDFWCYFSNASSEIKKHLLQQIRLPELLKELAAPQRTVVMKSAPPEVRGAIFKMYMRKLI